MRSLPSYHAIIAEFRESLRRLDCAAAYEKLARSSSSLLEAAKSVDTGLARMPTDHLLNTAVRAYAEGNLEEADRKATEVVAMSDSIENRSIVDARHILARLNFDSGQREAARGMLEQVLDQCRELVYADGYVRALHEISRIKMLTSDLFDAEAGFRIAANYYAGLLELTSAQNVDVAESHRRNMAVALKCLAGVADQYLFVCDGTIEGNQLIDSIKSPNVSTADGSGDDFLTVRCLALRLLTADEMDCALVDLMAKAFALYDRQRPLARMALEEATWHAERRGVEYPSSVRSILLGENTAGLRSNPCYKPNLNVVIVQAEPLRHQTLDDAADSIESLHNYLTGLDAFGRYVYRGQTREYDAPLLPSAFRTIFGFDSGCAIRSAGGRPTLRGCGSSFVGEYNYCFTRYADVAWRERAAGKSEEEIRQLLSVYQHLLRDVRLAMAQDAAEYVSWQKAATSMLPEEEMQSYEERAEEWNIRIDNFHKRRIRNELLVRLFGYVLGTTFAQQFGLSSEGLDATKSVDVACFFASHDSSDFCKVPDNGMGVIYRVPFRPNDLAMRPLASYDFYTLPSVVDVSDVFYRFEREAIAPADWMCSMAAYVKSRITYGSTSTDTLLLPRDFLASSRVTAQGAVIIIPDEIREDLADRDPGIGGIRYPKFRFIEDLRTRAGVNRFYFRHTGRGFEKARVLTREQLWPRDDFLLHALVYLIAGSYRLGNAIPKRLELIDGGYSAGEFQRYLVTLYSKYRHSFLDPSSELSRSSFHTYQI